MTKKKRQCPKLLKPDAPSKPLQSERLNELVQEGVGRIEDMISGHVKALTEEEYRAALK